MDSNTIEMINNFFEQMGDTRSYSGRGMYGKKCLALAYDGNVGAFVADMLRTAASEDINLEVLADVLEDMKSDNLGRDTIYYFPAIPYVGNDNSEEDKD